MDINVNPVRPSARTEEKPVSATAAGNESTPTLSSRAADNPSSLLARQALYAAAEKGDRRQLYDAIFQFRDAVSEKNPKTGMTPLQAANRNGHTEAARILVNAGARVHEVNPNADPASVSLYAASENGDPELLKAVLAISTGKLNEPDPLSGLTPLMYAIRGNDVEVAKILIEAGADLNRRNAEGTPPIAKVLGNQETVMLQLLLDKGAAVDAKNGEGCTALTIAVTYGYPNAVQLLLHRGADIEAVDSSEHTALSHAISTRNKEMMTLLLKNKANIEHEVLDGGATPLSWASQLGYVEEVELLLSFGADVNHAGEYGDSPMMIASRYGHTGIAELLINVGADINHADADGNSLIMIASRYGYTEIVELLINAGAGIAQENKHLRTPLCLAAAYGHPQTVKVLLDSDRDLQHATRNCQRALTLAVKGNQPAVVELLLQRGAQVDKKIAELAKDPVIRDLLDRAASFAHPAQDENGEDHAVAQIDGRKLIAGLMSSDQVSKDTSADQWRALLQKQGVCKTIVDRLDAAASGMPSVWAALAGSNQRGLTAMQQKMWCAGILANLEHDVELRAPYSDKGLSDGTETSLNQIASKQVAAMAQAGLNAEGELKAHAAKLWSTCTKTISDDRCDPFELYNHLTQECGFYAEVAKLIASAFADVWGRRNKLGSVTLEQAFARELVERRKAQKWVKSINSVSADAENHPTFTMLTFRQIDLIDAWCKKTLPSN
jgi:uncharacterized protein